MAFPAEDGAGVEEVDYGAQGGAGHLTERISYYDISAADAIEALELSTP